MNKWCAVAWLFDIPSLCLNHAVILQMLKGNFFMGTYPTLNIWYGSLVVVKVLSTFAAMWWVNKMGETVSGA